MTSTAKNMAKTASIQSHEYSFISINSASDVLQEDSIQCLQDELGRTVKCKTAQSETPVFSYERFLIPTTNSLDVQTATDQAAGLIENENKGSDNWTWLFKSPPLTSSRFAKLHSNVDRDARDPGIHRGELVRLLKIHRDEGGDPASATWSFLLRSGSDAPAPAAVKAYRDALTASGLPGAKMRIEAVADDDGQYYRLVIVVSDDLKRDVDRRIEILEGIGAYLQIHAPEHVGRFAISFSLK